jgi:hypothetical protein
MTIANLKIAGIHDPIKIIAKEAKLIGKRQYPSRLAAWKKLILEPRKFALMNTTTAPIHMITKTEVMTVLD